MAHVYLNGEIIPEDQASIPINDRGFLYGDGIFETMKALDGQVEYLDDHIERLNGAAAELNLTVPPAEWPAITAGLLETNGLKAAVARVKIILTRGVLPPLGLPAAENPMLLITAVEQAPRKTPELIGIFPHRRQTPIGKFKSLNYLFNLTARQWALDRELDEAILLGADGEVLECSTSNLFILRDMSLIKPMNEGLYLEGIAGKHFMEKQKAEGLKIMEIRIFPEDIKPTDEIYITNSMIGAVKVELRR